MYKKISWIGEFLSAKARKNSQSSQFELESLE